VKAAIYARVSRGDLESENQLRELREFAARKAWDVFAEFVDEDVRGDAPRPQLQALLRAAHERRFDVAVFWSMDRMTRAGVKDAIDTLYAFDAAGVEFVSFREPFVNSVGPWRDAIVGAGEGPPVGTDEGRPGPREGAGAASWSATQGVPPHALGRRGAARQGAVVGTDGPGHGNPRDVAA